MAGFPERVKEARRRQRRKGCALLAGLGILFLAFAVYLLSQFSFIQRNYIYPYPHRNLVEYYADLYGVDSSLAAGVILTESKFKHDVLSHRGAVGLMQLMPDTAHWIAGQLEEDGYAMEALYEPDLNIRYGIWYLSSLEEEFQGNDVLALAAYNAGRGNVEEWMGLYGWSYDFADIEAIPYLETRAYVGRVLAARDKYRKLYYR